MTVMMLLTACGNGSNQKVTPTDSLSVPTESTVPFTMTPEPTASPTPTPVYVYSLQVREDGTGQALAKHWKQGWNL